MHYLNFTKQENYSFGIKCSKLPVNNLVRSIKNVLTLNFFKNTHSWLLAACIYLQRILQYLQVIFQVIKHLIIFSFKFQTFTLYGTIILSIHALFCEFLKWAFPVYMYIVQYNIVMFWIFCLNKLYYIRHFLKWLKSISSK